MAAVLGVLDDYQQINHQGEGRWVTGSGMKLPSRRKERKVVADEYAWRSRSQY